MRIAIINLTGGGISGGHRKYLQNMLPRLAACTEIENILCASPAGMSAGDWLPAIPKVSYSLCEPFRPFRHVPDEGLRAGLDAFKPDLLFIPIERYVNYNDLPVVVMLQNMAPLAGVKTGSGLKEIAVAIARRHETRIALERAAAAIVPTGYVKDFLAGKAGVPAEKLTVIHYGRNSVSGSARPPAAFSGGEEKFIFTAGSLEAYRGLEDLVRALPGLKIAHPDLKLVIAGGARTGAEKYAVSLRELAAGLGVAGDIAWLGNLPEAELSWCYSNCAAFALTSRMESFCFVALEALTHGCNIVSTRSACLPEIFKEAALYYEAGDESGLSLAVSAVLARTGEERLAAASAAAARAGAFSWDAAAGATLAVLGKAVRAR
ncbi:MAG TPA: hypothetical protein DCZ92_09440 [Elusimicrobia bacterium]|nr:MAG: hypothetical protein A2016_11395 [Elusimicrobia bacterium GWF2_62_30]HBA61025.1 hypothetical protein [Elusimicrobiota bacterium]